MPTPSPRTLVLIPTYNERENLPLIVARVFEACPDADILVLDDASPDGTGDVADGMSAQDPRLHVLHRTAKQGLGAAYLHGFAWGLDRDYDELVQMDADGSHPPETLPSMIDRARVGATGKGGRGDVGLVIGSRWVRGGRVIDWPRRRELLSRSANQFARIALGIDVRDATAGFRVYPADTLRSIDLSGVEVKGYGFQIDMTRLVVERGLSVVEVPIVFRDREFGESKMSGTIIFEAMRLVLVQGFRRRLRQLRGLSSGR